MCNTKSMLDTVIHKWLRIPYALHLRIHHRAKRSRATLLFIHGLGNSGAAWNDVIALLPSDVSVVSIDLLGFGKSPRPSWATYNVKTQARSVMATLIKYRLQTPVIIVGHSMGSLVGVEIARRYPLVVRSLILCSPPFYKTDTELKGLFPKSDQVLRRLFKYSKKHPEYIVSMSKLALKYGLVNAAFSVTTENVDVYMAALEASIINQTSLADAMRLRTPMTILVGQLDPVIVRGNLKELAGARANRRLITVIAGHEIQGLFIPAVAKAIEQQIKTFAK